MFRCCYKSTSAVTAVEWKDTVPFVPPIDIGYVIKVYDGDTITIAAKWTNELPIYRFPVRLAGIDCPEMTSKDENEKQCAVLAKGEMARLAMNQTVFLKNVQTEKYGRILADVYVGTLHLNQHMLDNRFAVKYDGGTKQSPRNWLEYHYSGKL